MKNIVRQTINYREKNNVSRKDMLQLLLQLRNTGKISADDNVWAVESVAGECAVLCYNKKKIHHR